MYSSWENWKMPVEIVGNCSLHTPLAGSLQPRGKSRSQSWPKRNRGKIRTPDHILLQPCNHWCWRGLSNQKNQKKKKKKKKKVRSVRFWRRELGRKKKADLSRHFNFLHSLANLVMLRYQRPHIRSTLSSHSEKQEWKVEEERWKGKRVVPWELGRSSQRPWAAHRTHQCQIGPLRQGYGQQGSNSIV